MEEFLDGAWFVTCQVAHRGSGAFVLARHDRPFARDEQFRLSGCHAGRDTAAAITDAGFTIERLERFRFPDVRLSMPTTPHILGMARRP